MILNMLADGFEIPMRPEYYENERVIVNIPAESNYIEILGHRIDGFSGFEEFLEHLQKCVSIERENEKLQNNWIELKNFLKDYKKSKERMDDWYDTNRYCVALSIDDILEKMDEIEGN